MTPIEPTTVREGDQLPELRLAFAEPQLFFFSAATQNGHRIHYDKGWAVDVEGHPDLVVHGPLQSATLARLVTDWAGPRGRLVSFEIQNRGSAYLGDEVVFAGAVRSVEPADGVVRVTLDIHGSVSDKIIMPGTAVIEMTRGEAG